ncbi:MAG: Phospholipase D [Chlamydiae bacterium]|nr:Phospholipase D [Chlamydiota bacterium]
MRYLVIVLLTVFSFAELQGSSAQCHAYFSSQDALESCLVDLIDQEEKSIKVAIYQLTHYSIAKALIRAKKRGVRVEVLIDPASIRARSSVKRLVENSVSVSVWDYQLSTSVRKPLKRMKPLMHDKFVIFGEDLVWTGSFNFTNNGAMRNQENAVTIKNREIARQFNNHFLHMKERESRPFAEYMTLYPKKGKERKSPTRYAERDFGGSK